MARSPFQGTFQPNIRPTVVVASDAVVYLNGEMEIPGCPKCSRTFNVNKYITSIQTDLGVDSAPGSGSINLAIPRHSIDDFYFDGNPVITPMMEVEIYAKGYYLIEGIPQYYPIFWGMITEVNDNYSGGEHTVSLHLQDILKWFELCQMNVNAAWTAPTGAMGRDVIKGNVFAQTNPYDIIFTLAFQSFGDVIVGTGSTNQFVADSKERSSAIFADMMFYWEKRFSRIRNSLLLYGTSGVAVRGDTLYAKYSRGGKNFTGSIPKEPIASRAVAEANNGGGMLFNAAGNQVAAMKRVASEAGQIDLWQSVYQTKLELANAAKEAIGFEFYMDVTGDIVFKPPFYNLDVIGNKPVSWIQDIDVIDWDFSDSESEVVTQIILQGSTFGTVDYGMPVDISPFTSVTDYHLLKKYGWRSKPCNSEFLTDPKTIFFYGLDMLDRINSHRHRGTVTIPMRPELRLGFPIYVAPKDEIWYINGISHSIQFGSRATTTLSLTAKRSKFIASQGMGDLQLTSYGRAPEAENLDEYLSSVAEANKDNTSRAFRHTSEELSANGYFTIDTRDAAPLPPSADAFKNNPGAADAYKPLILRHPKTGRIVGYPNAVLVYTQPFAPTDVNPQAGQKDGKNPRVSKDRQAEVQKLSNSNDMQALVRDLATNETAKIDKYQTNRYQYGSNSAGSYIYAHDSSSGGGVISEILLLPSKNLTIKPANSALEALRNQTSLIRPISDERGFEVIGHWPYGRRLSLRDGRLVVNKGTVGMASVDVQLALSGGLQEMLTAQSQGLTSIMTGYQDPASTLTKLTPDERQTAAVINQDTKKPEFVDVGDNFVSTAVLGSPEQKGSFDVEASQLSRALTLMEMSVKDASKDNEECVCLTGRQDLAFISTGYQVKTLSGTAENDSSSLNAMNVLAESGALNTPINSGATQEAHQNVAAIEKQLNQAQEKLTALTQEKDKYPDKDLDDPAYKAKWQAVMEQQKVVDSLGSQLVTAQDNLNTAMGNPYSSNSSIFTMTNQEVISRVDQFLTDLYKSLDAPHQEFEKAIRGDLMAQTPTNVSGLPGAKINPPSEFAPPFSETNRYNLGDPTAINGAIQTNTQNAAKAWSNFGNNLRKSSKQASLSRQISQDQASIQRLTATRNQLVSQQASHAIVIGTNVVNTIAKIDKQIAKLQQEIEDNQTKLNTNV